VLVTINSPANQPPTADAGADQFVSDSDLDGSESVTLDGSASTDTDGTIVNYLWTQGAVTLASSASPASIVTLPVGVHTVTLTVTDDDTATAFDTVTVTITQPANQNPIADAGEDGAATDSDCSGAESVQLDGSASTDPDGTIVLYRWSLLPDDTEIASGDDPRADVEFPVGVHHVRLTVTDNRGGTDTDDLTVTVAARCPADYNQDGGIDGSDVDAFFNDWEGGFAEADVNCDGGVDGADVDTFFQAWENGGCF